MLPHTQQSGTSLCRLPEEVIRGQIHLVRGHEVCKNDGNYKHDLIQQCDLPLGWLSVCY